MTKCSEGSHQIIDQQTILCLVFTSRPCTQGKPINRQTNREGITSHTENNRRKHQYRYIILMTVCLCSSKSIEAKMTVSKHRSHPSYYTLKLLREI